MSTTDKINGGPSKSFMTVGPTLHYSHTNVHGCWAVSILIYAAVCLFWTWMHTGQIASDPANLGSRDTWQLYPYIVHPLSIYQYPWQILILGLLMGMIALVPLLIAQLLSFLYSIPCLLMVAILARMPLLAGFLLISCVAVACRPLRFRSRFISIALCMAPQLGYWIWFAGGEQDPIRWGFSFAPWFCAWLSALVVAAGTIIVGHFNRYRPLLLWTTPAIVSAVTLGVFVKHIGFAELDYQLYIAGNNPEEVREFQDHDLSAMIDRIISDPTTRGFLKEFYPTDPILLRKDLIHEIQIQLGFDRWPNWLDVPHELKYQEKRQQLLRYYDQFMTRWPNSKRMPLALYSVSMLNEYSPDIRSFGQTEVLRFNSDYPHYENLLIWLKLLERFPLSPESIEARYRYAVHLAGREQFDKADELCAESIKKIELCLNQVQPAAESDSFWAAFSPASKTLMTPIRLRSLRQRVQEFQMLIGPENRRPDEASRRRLSQLVMLNPSRRDYPDQIEDLLSKTAVDDPLLDNLLLARAMAISDPVKRAEALASLHQEHPKTDGGIQAQYELGVLSVGLWKDKQAPEEQRTANLRQARAILSGFVSAWPDSLYAAPARELLSSLPTPP